MTVDIIIGCESFTIRNARIDFGNSRLSIIDKGNIVNFPFLREDDEQTANVKNVENYMSGYLLRRIYDNR